jgi:membrane protein implicated in regulation of membrane protease activity
VTGLDGNAHWVWLGAAAALAILELVFPGVFLVWIALAAAGTSIAVLLFGPSLPYQVMVFAILSVAFGYVGRWYGARAMPSADPDLNNRVARLIGRQVTVVGAIEGGEGRVKVGDSVWSCRGPDCPAGTAVRIVGADGICLEVEPEPAQLTDG